MRGMRKRYRVLLFAAVVAAFVVRVGFALSLENKPVATTIHSLYLPSSVVASTAVASTVLVSSATAAAAPLSLPDVPDAAKLLLVGTILFVLAAAVRKAI